MKTNMLDIIRRSAAMLLCWSLFCAPAAAETMVLHSEPGEPLSNHEQTGFLDRVAAEAFRRNGLELKLVKLPAQRGLSNANAGIEDGELIRIAGIEETYPNLLRVPEKMIDLNFVAFTRNPSIAIDGWNSLLPYSVGYVRGWKIYETNVPEAVTQTPVNDGEILFALLEKNRIDVALFSEYLGLDLIHRLGVDGVRLAGPPLASREMFMYLNKKHSEKIAGISAALKAIKTEGIYGLELARLKSRYPEIYSLAQ